MTNNQNQDIVTIDGPSGSGKSTISRLLASRLHYAFLDTGAMYRAVGLKLQQTDIDCYDAAGLNKVLENLDLKLEPGDQDTLVILDGEDVSLAIRTAEMGMVASKVSAVGAVRAKLTDLQQQMGAQGGVVAEGRDTGTIVFPQAKYKFFLNATPEERARRRTEQLEDKGLEAKYDEILDQIIKRDHDDSTRSIAPLMQAEDAVPVDSSHMTIDQVINFMMETIAAKN